MRINQTSDNGNVVAINLPEHIAQNDVNNSSWHLLHSLQSERIYQNGVLQHNANSTFDNYETSEISEFYGTKTVNSTSNNLERVTTDVNKDSVCNRQYRIYTQNNINLVKSCNNKEGFNLAENAVIAVTPDEALIRDTNVYPSTSPCDEERAFELSDTDEMSENGIQTLPRGIVNPNYPGFQHLAHTLQDYSSNIENFYQSENDMTDDDIDVEITELIYESETNQNSILETKNININNNNNETILNTEHISEHNNCFTKTKILDSHVKNEIPDLIKTVSRNNNNVDTVNCDFNYSDTDIENNFNTKDIIGDFNKEIEDEIKQLLNYNINIQDDLEELRKDIKDSLAKPIENTINNISDVVNHVIKKLVQTNNEYSEDSVLKNDHNKNIEEDKVNKENETNTRTEMNLSRPTFLLIENNTNTKIVDAHLSDGKDEINIYDSEYDTEKLGNDVENTIKQLSTELRKIIPKLDEMRERDKLWLHSNSEARTVVTTDGNSNEVAPTCFQHSIILHENKNKSTKEYVNGDVEIVSSSSVRQNNESRTSRDRQKPLFSPKDVRAAQINTSVRKNSVRECDLGSFDVYNIETALPKLDLDAIESHLKAAKEAERRKRNDREEIRKRLAMGADNEEYYSMGHTDRPGKKPSLHSRLQNGMNLQICFMNETASDNESQASDIEKNLNHNNRSSSRSSVFSKSSYNHPYQTRPLSVNITKQDKISTAQSGAKLRPTSLSMKTSKSRSSHSLGHIELKESDFYALQATLQTEARIALAQAKEMARIQMERERRSRPVSPVTEMLRRSMEKASAPLAADRRRVSRQLLTDMNIAQLQVIVNELHSQIECLNDSLVKLLMARDELHMGQDSMLVDIEDLTRYLGVKEQTKKTKGTTKSGVRRLTSLVHK